MASAPAPVMFDSPDRAGQPAMRAQAQATPGRGQSSGTIDTQVVADGDNLSLVLKPDPAFLSAPDTQYPTTIDPAVTLNVRSWETIYAPCADGTQLSSADTVVGIIDGWDRCRAHGYNNVPSRALVGFDLSSLVGQQITSARLDLTTTAVGYSGQKACPAGRSLKISRLTAAWQPSTVRWNNQPGVASDDEVVSAPPAACTGAGLAENMQWSTQITKLVQAWAGGAGLYGLRLSLTDEATGNGTFYWNHNPVTLSVTYGSTPAIENLRTAPVAGADGTLYTNTLTPSLYTGVRDNDGGAIKVDFEVEHDPADTSHGGGAIWTGSVADVPAGNNATIAVPAGKLGDGWKIRWRARAFDGTSYSTWAPWQQITIDITPPHLIDGEVGCNYPENTWKPRDWNGDSHCFARAADPDTAGYMWGLDDPSLPNWTVGKYMDTGLDVSLKDVPDGWHTMYIKVRDKAHNTSALWTYSFGIGPGGMISPMNGSRTQRSVSLIGAGPADRTQIRYQYRTGTWDWFGFTDIPLSDVTALDSGQPLTTWPQTRTDTSKNFGQLSWNMAKTLQDRSAKDGYAEIRACLSGGSTAEACSTPIKVTLDQSAFGDSYPSADLGPGKLALQNGDYSLTSTDASLFGVSVSRTLTTLQPQSLQRSGEFGPGWTASFPAAPSWVSEFVPSSGGESGSLQLVGADGSTLSYVKNGNSFAGIGDAADGTRIINSGEELIVTDSTGSKTTYTKPNGVWVVTRTETPAAESAVTYLRDAQGRLTRVLAPTATGITCETTLTAGCRALELSYASTTTATGVASGWGDFKNQAKSVSFTAFDPESNAMKTTVLASYLYDSTGHLRQVTDPRTNLATVYYYTGEGRISQVTPPGLAPWRMEYDTRGRLAHVQREGGDIDPTQAIAYDVPTGGAGAPIDLTATQTAKWGQSTDLPTVGTAIFPASHVPARASDGSYKPMAADWEYSALTYTDVNGRGVNSAQFGAGAWQVSATRYDDKGNTLWELSPENRAQALTPTADTDPYVAGRGDSVERANLLATARTYNDDSDPLTVTDPARQVQLADGALVSARKLTTTSYDEGKPSASTVYHLATTTKAEPVVLDGTAVPAMADVRTVKTGFDPIKSGDASGWDLRQSTSTTIVMPGQTDIVRKTRYDAAAREIERRQPASSGDDAGSTATIYYTAGAHPLVTACGNKPQWAGLACRRTPVAQPSGKPLPVTTLSYGYYGGLTSSVETAGTTVRTTTTTFDTAGRPAKTKIEVTPAANGGTPVPESVISYDPATGLRSGVTAGTLTLTNGYDTFGRLATTSDADGNTTTVGYTLDSQVASTIDAKGSITYTYNGTDAAGRAERRGLPTSITAQRVGTFTAAYTGDGELAMQGYPNGLTAANDYDSNGFHHQLTYAKGNTVWLSYRDVSDIHGKVTQSSDTQGTIQRYTYDHAGRLIRSNDATSASCTVRQYTLDANSNRKSLQTFPADASGACSTNTTPVTKASGFDTADRITDAGYTYDAFGRTTTVPATDVTGGADLTVGYHANEMVASLTQNGTTKTYGLDPRGRVRTINTTTSTGSFGTLVNHYTGGADSPSWVAEANGAWTRNITAFTGLVAIERSDGSSQLKLTNLHGDVTASCGNNATDSISAYHGYTEYGLNRPDSSSERYGWLGARQRSSGDSIGGLILMGARLYNPTTGRFLQTDPMLGGSDNAYEYTSQDPINNLDLDGTKKKPAKKKKATPKPPKKSSVSCSTNIWGTKCKGYLTADAAQDELAAIRNMRDGSAACGMIGAAFAATIVGGVAATICGALFWNTAVGANQLEAAINKSNGNGVFFSCTIHSIPGARNGCEYSPWKPPVITA
ncbi:DNRLRE domain-containing protein [Nonomuraea sp. RK-328]|nr:DNRLRE domain-containing protein [Nonomuraea sp. RK-328]